MTVEPALPVIVLSHRGPVSFRREGDKRAVRRGAGGLVTALTGLASQLEDAVWVCAAVTDEDAVVAREHDDHAVPVALGARSLDVRMVVVDDDVHDDFYSVISNPLLWFVQHGLYGLATSPVITRREHDAFEDGYVAANDAFADAVAQEVADHGGRALVMLHDYHFYLVAEGVRRRCPEAVITHFVHIPWPDPDGWRVLPPAMRDRLLRGLLGADVVSFHTRRFARNFLLCAQELLGLPVDLDRMTVRVDDRTVAARAYPISIDVGALEELVRSPAVTSYAEGLEESLLSGDRRLLLRVDRTDPSKNIVRGFLAFERLLEEHAELRGRVTFLALLQPSRQDVPEYADYLGRIGAIVARINAAYERRGHEPVDLRLLENLPLAVAAYTVCDTLVVNSVADGMNLVAKEVMTVSRRDAVLLLSENAGAHEELGEFGLTVHPFDVQQQAEAMYAALTMPAPERRARREAAAHVVRTNDVGHWLDAQLADLVELTDLPVR